MDSTKRMIKFQNYGDRKSLEVFWLIMIAINIFSYILNYYIGTNSKAFYFSIGNSSTMSVAGLNVSVAFIYLLVVGICMYYKYFPIAIGFSVTRKSFYKSVIVSNITTCLTMAIISGLLLKVDRFIITAIGREALVDFTFFNIIDDNIIYIIFSLFIQFLITISISNFFGVLLYRLGAVKFWGGVLLLFIVIQSNHFKIVKNILDSLGKIFTTRITPINLIYLLIIGLILYSLGYFIIMRTDVKVGAGEKS